MNQTDCIQLNPIGVVRSPIKEVADDCWGGIISTIELDPQLFAPECTLGLDQYSHVDVVFLLNKFAEDKVEKGARHLAAGDGAQVLDAGHGAQRHWRFLGVFVKRLLLAAGILRRRIWRGKAHFHGP